MGFSQRLADVFGNLHADGAEPSTAAATWQPSSEQVQFEEQLHGLHKAASSVLRRTGHQPATQWNSCLIAQQVFRGGDTMESSEEEEEVQEDLELPEDLLEMSDAPGQGAAAHPVCREHTCPTSLHRCGCYSRQSLYTQSLEQHDATVEQDLDLRFVLQQSHSVQRAHSAVLLTEKTSTMLQIT